MKNFEAYENDIRLYGTGFALQVDNTLTQCTRLACEKCKFSCNFNKGIGCNYTKIEWLYKEHKKLKPKISRATKAILENLNPLWKWIAKDMDGEVYISAIKPHKITTAWSNDGAGAYLRLGNLFKDNLFYFLSWEDEEPTNIKELLENCEVIE